MMKEKKFLCFTCLCIDDSTFGSLENVQNHLHQPPKKKQNTRKKEMNKVKDFGWCISRCCVYDALCLMEDEEIVEHKFGQY